MKTAQEAREQLYAKSKNLKDFQSLVEDAIAENTNQFSTCIPFTESELSFLGDVLNYSISWNRALLRYEIEF